MSKAEELKKIREEAKELREKQRKLQEAINEGAEERKEARKIQANARKDVRAHTGNLRANFAGIYEIFKSGDIDKIRELADEIAKDSTMLCESIKDFSDAAETLDEL